MKLLSRREPRVIQLRCSKDYILFKGWQQCTGFKDSNGVEIWEGDFVRYFDHECEVFFVDGSFCIYIDPDCYLELSQIGGGITKLA